MNSVLVSLVSAVVTLSVGVSMLWTPGLARRGLWFAVTVHPAFPASAEGRRTLRMYRWTVVLSMIAALALIAAAQLTSDPGLSPAGTLVVIGGSVAGFLAARRRTLVHAAAPDGTREATPVPRRESLPGGLVLQAGTFALIGAAAAWVGSRWAELPARFPIHWGADGQPNGWATRTPMGVFGPAVTGAVLCALLCLLALALLGRSRPVSAAGAHANVEMRFRRRVLPVLVGAEYLIALVLVSVTTLPVMHSPELIALVILVLTVVFTLASIAALARVRQGGARLRAEAEGPSGDRTLDAHWRWGMFYVNRADPALFVEKRFGVGYTLNLGNRWAWLFFVGLLVPFALIILLRPTG